jgi:hypothetical protein
MVGMAGEVAGSGWTLLYCLRDLVMTAFPQSLRNLGRNAAIIDHIQKQYVVSQIKTNNMALKEEEAAVYDRQLRVWGVETQKK